MAKYRYGIEHEYQGKWTSMIGMQDEGMAFLQGYIFGRRDSEGTPCNGIRLVRSDGKVIDERRSCPDVGIGMVAGFPTAEQYEHAASRAVEAAKRIRSREASSPEGETPNLRDESLLVRSFAADNDGPEGETE